jgi:hypothetical protein
MISIPLASLVLLALAALLLVLLAVLLLGSNGKKDDGNGNDNGNNDYNDDNNDNNIKPTIHVSGIYSILRESPRASLSALRPNEAEIMNHLSTLNSDVSGVPLSNSDRIALVKHWKMQTEVNLREIESGDKNGAAFYYYDFLKACPVCAPFVAKGNFVTREEIYRNPQIIPPLHIGCTCVLNAHHGSEQKMRETVAAGMLPFFGGDAPPPLPEWTSVISTSLSATAEGA